MDKSDIDNQTVVDLCSYGIKRCDRVTCITCSNRLCLEDHFINYVTGERFNITLEGSCRTRNCIYIIKCKHVGCQMQYVGHTVNQIYQRISQHKSSIIRGAGCKILREHFTNIHTIADMCIMPIEYLPENITLKEREELEDSWTLKCNTLFPYGLNARCKKIGIMDSELEVNSSKSTVYSYFDVVKVTRGQRGGVNQSAALNNFDTDTFLDLIFNRNIEGLRTIRTEICKLKKVQLKNLYSKAIGQMNNGFDCYFKKHTCLLVKDLAWFYLNRMKKDVKKKASNFIIIDYCNKFVECANLKKNFGLREVVQVSPFKSTYCGFPMVSYRYGRTVCSKVLNYRKTHLDNLDDNLMSCNCTDNAQFINKHHQHVFTGDLTFIENTNLRTLLAKGLNYRDQTKPSKSNAIKAIKGGLCNYINKMSKKLKKPLAVFDEWKWTVLDHVENSLKSKKPYNYNSVLSDNKVIDDLKKLHEEYVLVPTDKASNNVTIVCKKFYVSLINKEILSNNFQVIDKTPQSIVEEHKQFLDTVGIKMETENERLPYLYCTPKQHKDPIGFGFITAGYHCTLQQLSVHLGICLKSMLHSAKNYSKYHNRFHNRNDYFVIDGHEEVLDFITTNNSYNSPKSISTFDFSTLYTSIPHDQLKCNLKKFVDRVFDFKDKQFIIPNTYTKRGYFSSQDNKREGFDKDSLLTCLYYLIDNAYVVHNGLVYRQIIGIPMGTNAGPHIANIYLHVYEFDSIQDLIEKRDEDTLKKLQYIFRFQDDLISFNDFGGLENYLELIYPKELIVNNTNISPRKCSYLDLLISIYRGKFRVKLFDKRTSFPFNVISCPFLEGNIPIN